MDRKYLKIILSFLLVGFFFIWDIHNPNSPRQGTESLYLQISKEMWEKDSYFTLLSRGEPHFSKPPIHFWISHVVFLFSGGASLGSARMACAFFALIGIWGISRWCKKYLFIPEHLTIIWLGGSVVFLKFARIYMMEIPLMIFSCLCVLQFYDYMKTKKIFSLWMASFLLGAGILVKGPVSLCMTAGGIGFYIFFFRRSSKDLKGLFIWMGTGIFIASLWFFYSYFTHGKIFIDKFFLIENMGKFKTDFYSPLVLFQGLIVYGLPWTFFIPLLIFHPFKKNSPSFYPLAFLFSCFLTSFIIWFLPSQRSHHYAVPATPYLLIGILAIFEKSKTPVSMVLKKTGEILICILLLFLLIVVMASLFIGPYSRPSVFITVAVIFVSIIVFVFSKSTYIKSMGWTLSLGHVWVVFSPIFFLPLIPSQVVSLVGDNEVVVNTGRPYFIEQAFSREVSILDEQLIKRHIKHNEDSFYIVSRFLFNRENLKEEAEVVHNWFVWKRNRKLSHIWEAVKKRDLALLKKEMFLIKKSGY